MPQTTRLQKPCIGYYDRERHVRVPCGKLCARSRCDEHEAMYQRTRRPSAPERGYDAQYRKDRARLLAPDPKTGARVVCELQLEGCTLWADTADHDDPLLGGKNLAARRGHLTPACKSCNSRRGARPVLSVGRNPPGLDPRATSGDVTRDDGGAERLEAAHPTIMPDGSVR